MAAALRRLVLPTISRGRLAPRHPTPSFSGAATTTTKTGQGHRQTADRCMVRLYGTEDAAAQERKEILEANRNFLVGTLILWSIYGASLAYEYYWPSARHEHDFPEDDDI